MANSLFITLEGGEGTGKTTQMKILAERIEALGHKVTLTLEPGGTPLGKTIRRQLVANSDDPPSPRAELLLYAADRAHHVDQVILPTIEAGGIVLCDRYADATEAYQGWGRGIDLYLIKELNDVATGGLYPHRTLWFDLDPIEGIRRSLERMEKSGSSESRFEEEALSFHENVRRGYREIFKREPERVRRIDASGTIEEVALLIWENVKDLFEDEA